MAEKVTAENGMAEKETGVTPRVLVAASGTGGHILPAVYVANALREVQPDAEFLFVGSGRPLEQKLIEGNGYRRTVVPLTGLKRLGIKGALTFLCALPCAIRQTWGLLSSFQPHLIIGVGGYVSVLPVLLGALRGIPTWIHEAEHKAGRANWLLAFFSTTISTAWPETDIPHKGKIQVVGHPVRPALLQADFVRESLASPPRILFLGGSQGAQALDAAGRALASWFAERGVSVRHQCRPENEHHLTACYREAGVDAEVVSFVEDMTEALQWSDIVVSRAGAGAVRELALAGRPSILVPLPRSQEQRDNAFVLLEDHQAIVLQEEEGFVTQLRLSLEKLLVPEYYQHFNRSDNKRERQDVSREIAESCLQLIHAFS